PDLRHAKPKTLRRNRFQAFRASSGRDTESVAVNVSVVCAKLMSRARPPARFQAQTATPDLSSDLHNTTDRTSSGQSVASPVDHVSGPNWMTSGVPTEASSTRRRYPLPRISPTPPASVSVLSNWPQLLIERTNQHAAGRPYLTIQKRPSSNATK